MSKDSGDAIREKPDAGSDIGARYDHKAIEERIYKLWEKSGYFNPDNLPLGSSHPVSKKRKQKTSRRGMEAGTKQPFCILMPPPNANGSLHIGHAVGITLEDIMIRFNRMLGRKTLWLPGADHAGFETQVVFDKKLEKEGRNRFEMDRNQLWKEIWDFTQKNKEIMYGQLRRLGASCDWSREKFTLDPKIIKVVYDTFEKLFRDGLIYRDLKVINWCPKHRTALSDLEVAYVEKIDPLYYIKYGPLTLATVRPETKFGDTALAVNPNDKRYKKYIGKEIEAKDVLRTLKFKVIADEAVDPKFGTGVVKVTPAHDPLDFEIWQRHKDEIPGPKVVIDENGRLTGDVGEFKGMKVMEARQKVADKMEEVGILEKIEPNYVHQVATCYKCGQTLEPLPKPQWFVKTKPLAKPAIEAVQQGRIKIIPKRMEKVYLHWMKNIRDWNISRQIIWGIRIPAYFCIDCRDVKVRPKLKAQWFLVKHGQSVWNKENRMQGQSQAENSLSREGIAEVEVIAEMLKKKKIDLIISSDLPRCRHTAEIIAKATGAEIVFDKNLRERHFGIAQGMLKTDCERLFGNEFLYTYDGKPPGGESFRELETRVWAAFKKHKKNYGRRNVALVTHGGPIRAILKNLKNLTLEEALKITPANAEVIELSMVYEKCAACGSDIYEQDPDVFDTWFSSGQWPYATLKAGKKDDFREFYPTDVMETGYDILFFWVARMIMLGLYRVGEIPFRFVYLHGLVRDKDRQKMSKSKGNVIDPLGMADEYGADAVRMALVVGNTAGNDIVISEEKIRGYRNFATKIWNIGRFILLHRPSSIPPQWIRPTKEDKEYLRAVKMVKQKVTTHLERFEFHRAGEEIYHYVWHTFADKVIEAAKPRLRKEASPGERVTSYNTLESIYLECLKMLHPFMPFVTEEIYQKFLPNKMLMTEKWE